MAMNATGAALAALVACLILLTASSVFAQTGDSCSGQGLYDCVLNNSCTATGQDCCALVSQVYCGKGATGRDIGCAADANSCACLATGQVYCPDTGACAPAESNCGSASDPCTDQGMVSCQGTSICSPSQQVCDTCFSQGLVPCPTGTCAVSIEECTVPTTWKCEDYLWMTCNGTDALRSCAPSTELCFADTLGCENYGWMTCVDKCVPEAKFCIQSTCELQGLATCPRTGKCVQFLEQCDDACNTVVCPDGRCVLSEQWCQYTPCPEDTPVRCGNGECINAAVAECCAEGTIRCTLDPRANGTCMPIEDCVSPCNYMSHVRCPDGTCVHKTNASLCDPKCSLSGYKRCASGECIPEQEVCPCPEAGQIWCPLMNTCVTRNSTSAWVCKSCPTGAYRCQQLGQCVQDAAFCIRTDVPVCPPGQALCSKTRRCVDDLRFCTTDTCPHICPSTMGTALCVNDPAECCPTTRPFFCAATLSCLASASDCPGLQICNDPTPFKCWDGTCVTDRSACDCPTNLVKCNKTSQCVKRAEECSIIDENVCTGGVRCRDGTCKRSLTECGSMPACPSALVMCADGATCARDATSCPSVPTCDTSRPYFCASSGTCTIGPDYCPSSVNCGPNSFFCFLSKKCVSSPTDCTDSTGVACPTVAPFLCRDGSCRKSSQDCPTDPVCPTERPILCSSPRICVADAAECTNRPTGPDCKALNLTTCSDGQSCARSLSQCPSSSQCPPKYVLCDSGVCAPHVSLCPQRKNCTDLGLVACADGTCVKESVANCPTRPTCPANAPVLCQESGECVPSVDKCPPPRECPQDRPFKCPNRQCVRQKEECGNDVVCPPGFVRCPNSPICKLSLTDCSTWTDISNITIDGVICPVTGELKPSYGMCPKPPICLTKERPVLCWDLSCRANITECPRPVYEDDIVDSTERCVLPMVRCADGHCRKVSDCPQIETSCPNNIPVKCEDGTCRRTTTECPPPKTLCAAGQILCWDRRTCVDRLKPYDCPPMTTCPDPKSVLCWDRTCRSSLEQCPNMPPKPCNTVAGEQLCWNQQCAVQCPPYPVRCNSSFPVLCPDHTCRATKDDCTAVPSSPCQYGHVFCPRDGRCYIAADIIKCELSKPDCPSGFVLCADGRCVRKQSMCSMVDIGPRCPPQKPVLCVTTHKCIDPIREKCPSASFCPPRLPYRCPGGLCVHSAKDCPKIDPNEATTCIKLGLGKTLCSNGRCTNDSRECEAVWPCDPTWVRCDDGSCSPRPENCSTIKTCPSTLSFRCPDGSCAASENRCRNPSGCLGTQTRCPNGLCVSNSSDCTLSPDQDAPLSNGCTSRKPIRCAFTGECVTLESYCPNSQLCPSWAPFRCTATRTCMKDAIACSSAVPTNCTDFTCPDSGECVSNLRLCKNRFGCPLTKPVRCSTGDCATSFNDCPRIVRCTDDKPFLCADMSCVAESSQCSSIEPCPADAPIRCNDGRSCKATLEDCNSHGSKCPESMPVLCPDGKTCVRNPASCGKDANERCRAENPKLPFFCEATGLCVASPYECVSKLPPCDSTDRQALVRCPSGICAPADRCPTLPPCSNKTPFRCRDGSCAIDARQCQDSHVPTQPCGNMTHKRCADGVCRDQCTPVDGCMPGQIICPDRKCHDVSTANPGTFAEICRGSCNIGMVALFDGTCVNVTAPLPEGKQPKTFTYTLPTDGSSSEIPVSDDDDEDGDFINIGIFDLPNNTDTSLFVRPVRNISELTYAMNNAISAGLVFQQCSELSGVEISLVDTNGAPAENSILQNEVEIHLTVSPRCASKPNDTDICLAYLARNETTGEYEVHIEDCMGEKGFMKTGHFTPFFAVAAPVGNNPSTSNSISNAASSDQHSGNNNVSAATHLHTGGVALLLSFFLFLALAF